MLEHSPAKREHFAPFFSFLVCLSEEGRETVGVFYSKKCHRIPEDG